MTTTNNTTNIPFPAYEYYMKNTISPMITQAMMNDDKNLRRILKDQILQHEQAFYMQMDKESQKKSVGIRNTIFRRLGITEELLISEELAGPNEFDRYGGGM